MRTLVSQIAKFGVVGGIATAIDYIVLMILSQLVGLDTVLAAAISFILSLIFNYLASMRYVFERREDISHRREVSIFVACSLVGLALNEVCMFIGVFTLGSSAHTVTITKAIATLFVMGWNFASRKKLLDAS